MKEAKPRTKTWKTPKGTLKPWSSGFYVGRKRCRVFEQEDVFVPEIDLQKS
jgi:hypothetical protein